MKILVIGGTQFFGRKAVERLIERDCEITLMSRGRTPLPWEDGVIEHLPVDRARPADVTSALRGRTFDAVYDNIAMNAEHVRTVLDALGDTGQYLLMSSGSVYQGQHHVPIGEYLYADRDPKIPEIDWTKMMKSLDETAVPLDVDWLQREIAGEEGAYRKGKLEAERELVYARAVDNRGLHYTIFRPPQVEGPWDPTRRTEFFARRIADEGGILLPREGRGRIFQKVFRDDVASAVISALDNPRAHDTAYNVAQEEILSLERYFGVMSHCLDVSPPVLVDVPGPDLVDKLGPEYRPPLPGPKTVRLDRARRDLDYASSPYLEWMKETLDWILAGSPPDGYETLRERELQMMDQVGC